MKIFSIIVLVLVGLLLLGMALYLTIGAICFKIALARKNTASRIINKELNKLMDQYQIDFCWWDKFEFEKLSLLSKDGLKLVGHFLPNSSDKLAILVHGYGADYREMQKYAKYFVEKNYNILAVENRAHGESEGKMMGMGWLDRLDVLQWINLMLERNPNFQIVLFGLSMGASTVCMVSGEKLPSNVKAIISDCAYTNAYDAFKNALKSYTHLPSWPVLNIFNVYVKSVYKFDLKNADAVKQVKKCKVPILFIHGGKDTFVPTEMVHKLYEAADEKLRELYIVEDAGHALSYPLAKGEYEKVLNKFLAKALKN